MRVYQAFNLPVAAALQVLTLTASFVALFVNWKSVFAFGMDSTGNRLGQALPRVCVVISNFKPA